MNEKEQFILREKTCGMKQNAIDRSGSGHNGAHSKKASREPRVNFSEHANRGMAFGFTTGKGNPLSGATGNNRPRNSTNNKEGSAGSKPVSNERPAGDEHANRMNDSSNSNHWNQEIAQPSDSDLRVVPEPQTADMNDQKGYSRDETVMPTHGVVPHKVSTTNERSEKPKKVFTKQDNMRMNPTVV